MPTLVKEIKVKNQNNTYDTAQISTDADLVEFDNTGSNIVATDVEGAIKEVNTNIGNKSTVSIAQAQGSSSGVAVGTAVVDGTTVNLYAPVEANPAGSGTATPLTRLKVGSGIYSISGGGGGSEVEVTPVITSTDGVTKIADVSVDGVEADLYASVVKANPAGTSGNDLTRLQIDGTDYNIPVGSEVIANPSGTSGTNLTRIQIDGTDYNIQGGGSGSTVVVTPIISTGTNIADISVDGSTEHLYAPTPINVVANTGTGTADLTTLTVGSTTYDIPAGTEVVANPTMVGTENDLTSIQIGNIKYNNPVGSTVVANPSGTSSTDLTKISVDGSIYNIPSGGGSGDSVSWNQITQSGTKIAEVTINSTTTDVYAPNSSGGASALEDLTDVVITTPSNDQAIVYDSTNFKWINKDVGNTKYRELTQSQYDALSSAEKNNGTVYFITDASGGGGGGGTSWDYSTTETDTGQKWVDGKSIYCKVMRYNYNCSLTNGSGGSTFTVDPPASNVETIVNAFAVDNGLYTTLIIKEIGSSTIKINSSAPSITITSSTGYFCYFYTKSVS